MPRIVVIMLKIKLIIILMLPRMMPIIIITMPGYDRLNMTMDAKFLFQIQGSRVIQNSCF